MTDQQIDFPQERDPSQEASTLLVTSKGVLDREGIAKEEAKQDLRRTITKDAGDVASLLGTTSDAASLAIYGLATLVAKLSTAQSLAEAREAAAPFAALSAGFLAKVESGDVKLPFLIKGIESVVADIEARSTAVSDAIIEANSNS